MTYLFIWTILAGTCPYTYNSASASCTPEYKANWVNVGKFDLPEYCKKAAANLGLNANQFRCIKFNGDVM